MRVKCALVAVLLFVLSGSATNLYAAPPAQEADFPHSIYAESKRMFFLDSDIMSPLHKDMAAGNNLASWSKLVFQSFRSGKWKIYLANGDGSGQTLLTEKGSENVYPRLNRGCTRIVFSSDRAGNYDIFTMNLDGSDQTRLTFASADDYNAAWSPDGTKIAFSSYRDGQSEVYVMNADGSDQTRLTWESAYDGGPVWSPDGTKIAFRSGRTGANYIWVMNVDGSGQTQLSTQPYSEGAAWSPDGSRIAYDADGNGDGWQELWVMNADGSNQRQVYDPPESQADAWSRSWSPDGRYLAFTRIFFIQYRGNWYWTAAYLDAWDSVSGDIVRLSGQGRDWYPDWQTTDILSPSSSVNVLPAQSPGPFTVSWSGVDEGAAGIQGYDVQVRDGASGAWTAWLTNTMASSEAYPGIGGHTYHFRVRARDNSNNVEQWTADYEAVTTVEALPPLSAVNTLPGLSRDQVMVTWGGTDPGWSGIKAYDVQYRVGASGRWTDWQINTPITSAHFSGTPGATYYFRARSTDNAQNVEDWPAGDGDTLVAFYSWQITGVVHDNAGVPVSSTQIIFVPTPISVAASDSAGNYAGYGLQSAPAYSATWSKNGYGGVPVTMLPTLQDTQLELVLPPINNIVSDGGFESGGFAPAVWQTSGVLPTSITGARSHTGKFMALLGETFSPGWGNTEKVSDVPLGYGLWNYGSQPRVAVDSRGVVHAVWTAEVVNDNFASVFYANKLPGGSWSAPVKLSGDVLAGSPDITVDGANNLHVAWSGFRAYYTVKPSDGDWSAPAYVSDSYMDNLRIMADRWGSVHLIGQDLGGIVYAVRSKGQWSPLSLIAAGGSYPSLVVDHHGTVHALWAWYDGFERWMVNYSSKPKDGLWSPVMRASSGDAWMPDLAVDAVGTLHGVWGTLGPTATVEYRNKPLGANWSVPLTVALGSQPRVVARHGQVGVVYFNAPSIEDSYEIFYTGKVGVANWSEPVMLSPQGNWSIAPHLVAEPDGVLHVVWFEWTQSGLGNGAGEIQYRGPISAGQTGDAIMAQGVTIPITMPAPTLSFLYQLGGASTQNDSGFHVQLQTMTSTASLLFTQMDTSDWIFQSFDLSAWAGQTITVTFLVHQVTGTVPTWALVDDVTIGSPYPDVWIGKTGTFAMPGEQVVYKITYGNQGGATANNVRITDTLPAGLTFVDADPPPTFNTLLLAWQWGVGDVPPKSGPFTIVLTATAAPTVPMFSSLTNLAGIQSASSELEKANNTAQAVTFVGRRVYLPIVMKA